MIFVLIIYFHYQKPPPLLKMMESPPKTVSKPADEMKTIKVAQALQLLVLERRAIEVGEVLPYPKHLITRSGQCLEDMEAHRQMMMEKIAIKARPIGYKIAIDVFHGDEESLKQFVAEVARPLLVTKQSAIKESYHVINQERPIIPKLRPIWTLCVTNFFGAVEDIARCTIGDWKHRLEGDFYNSDPLKMDQWSLYYHFFGMIEGATLSLIAEGAGIGIQSPELKVVYTDLIHCVAEYDRMTMPLKRSFMTEEEEDGDSVTISNCTAGGSITGIQKRKKSLPQKR
jgi:hypothetical protein